MRNEFSSNLKIAFKNARDITKEVKCSVIRIEHVIYGMITSDNEVTRELLSDSLYQDIVDELKDYIKRTTDGNLKANATSMQLESNVQVLLQRVQKSSGGDDSQVTVSDFFRAIFERNEVQDIIPPPIEEFFKTISRYVDLQPKRPLLDEIGDNFNFDDYPKKPKSDKRRKSKDARTPALDSFSRDLTVKAEQGLIDPVIGRENEIERVAQILGRRKKNNPIIIGEAGVGKCVDSQTVITLRDDSTGEVLNIKISDLI